MPAAKGEAPTLSHDEDSSSSPRPSFCAVSSGVKTEGKSVHNERVHKCTGMSTF